MGTDAANRAKVRRMFDEHYDAISRYCHRRLPPADANDAAAAVFAVAWRKIDAVPSGEQVLPWLYGVARNEVSTVRRSMRRLQRLRAKLDTQPERHDPGPETVVVRSTDHDELVAALSKLRPSDQEVIRLRAYEQLTLPEIAAVLGCSHEAAKKRSARAMKRLRRTAGIGEAAAGAGRTAFQEESGG